MSTLREGQVYCSACCRCKTQSVARHRTWRKVPPKQNP
jgi:hypothetical protein